MRIPFLTILTRRPTISAVVVLIMATIVFGMLLTNAAPAPITFYSPAPLVQQPPHQVVISQVYGGGGNSGATYRNDYVELYNRGNTTVNLNGWTIQYASATGTTWHITYLYGSLAPGHYYLIQQAQGVAGTQDLPSPDATGSVSMNATAGKVALLTGKGCLNVDDGGYDCEWDNVYIVDLVGYGSNASTFEGTGPTVGLSNTTAILRGANGCIDLNDNRSDFDTSTPSPRNSSTTGNTCASTNPSTSVVISEFRTRGPNGGNDEFVELYNKSDAPINISGWKIKGSSNTGSVSTRVTINQNVTLPSHGHFLVTNAGSSGYSGTVPGDQTYTVGITDNGGLALTRTDDSIVDQVGMHVGSAFKEGRVLESFTINTERSYERKPGSAAGSGQDSDDNKSDFLIRTPSDPQNLGIIPSPETGVKIVHINVGQGDATLIIGPSKTLLFDAGPTGTGPQIRAVLNSNNLTSLDYFVAGHYHEDHIGAIDELINSGIPINTASYDRAGDYASQAFNQYLNAVGTKRTAISLGQQIDLGGGCIATCVAVNGLTNNGGATPADENARSVALVLRFGTFDYFIASDLTGGGLNTTDVESFVARSAGDVDVLHVSHHGSSTSTNQTLVNTLHAEQAVISVGDGNSYGHPTQEVLNRLNAAAYLNTIWQTETGAGGTSNKVRVGGNITFLTNGTTYSVSTSVDPQTYSFSTDGIAGAPLPGPQANAGGPYYGISGTSVLLNGGGSSVPSGTITSYQWNFGDGTSGTGVNTTHVFSTAGTYTIKLTVTDNNGAKASGEATASIVPPNQPPVASAGGPYSALSQTSIQFDGTGSGDPDGTISSHAWNFGDGNTASGALPSHTYSLPGTYTATLTVTDNVGATASAAATVSISNRAPQANPGGPYSGPKQTSIQFQGGASTDLDGSIVNYAWNFGDGTVGSGATPTHTYASVGNYTVTVTVTDNLGATATGSTIANINTAPTSNPGGPYSGISGMAVQMNGSASTDPDGALSSYQWTFGDGSTGSGIAPLHVYASPGTYVVTLTVVDSLGAWSNNSVVATITSVTNKPPIAHVGGPSTATIGTAVQFNGTGSTDPDGTITHYQWTFGDGTASGPTPTHTFAASGTHLVTLTVTDNGGATNSRSINLNVTEPEQGGGGEPLESGDVNWDPSTRDAMDDPNNQRGNVANTTTGNKNFQVVAPVLALPGRGSQLSLNLVYNSQVWTKSGNEILFDIDHDFPAPGWHLGFGKMVMMGTAGAMIIEPDGTRHPFTGTVFRHFYPPYGMFTNGVWVDAFKGHTTDGSNIEYRAEGNVGVARYPNGTIIRYSHYTGTVPETYIYPNQIIDANGNIINISYIPNCNPIPDPTTEPRIQRIVDSVGRVITFNYDSQQRLTSLSGPGLPDANGNATTQTLVRIHYKTQTLNLANAFTGLMARTKSTTLSVIDAIYYPATGRGYWFGGDSYSSYGMLTRVTEERGMTFAPGASPNEQGTISEGTITRQQVYNYPSAPAGLNGVPSFTELTESWDGGPVNALMTKFNIVDNSGVNERTITITQPDGTKNIQKSFNFTNASNSDPDKWKDGTVKEQQTTNSAGNVLSKTVFEWQKGPDDAPRLLRTETTDDVGQVLKNEYDEYGPDNRVGRIRDYDYDGTTVIRTTRNSFISYLDDDLNQGISSQYQVRPLIHPRLVNLIASVSVFEGDDSANKLAAFTENKYDEYAAPLKAYTPDYLNTSDLFACGEPRQSGGISGILNHAGAYNPMPFNPQNGGGLGDQYFTRRGNVTSVKRYADTSNSSAPANPITETRTYDMAGNVIAASRSCCEETSSVFELATQFAYAVSQTRGSSDPTSLARVTTSAQYDLSTGLPKTRIDENGRPTTLTYFPGSLRPKEILYPTGAVTSFEYDDPAAKVTQTSRLSANGTIANQTIKYLNGLGQVIREEAVGPGNTIDVVETVYDSFGRLSMQTRPYRNGTSIDDLIWTETIYDTHGRVMRVREDATHEIADDPATQTNYAYNETPRPPGASSNPGQTTKITDPWGRWRWSRVDANGRLVEVVEPNPAGGTNFRTTYTYNTLGNLVRVDQGDQVRRFKFDSLGRLTHQKLAEAIATLNSAGEPATGEPESERWSEVFTYDQRSNLTSRTDARGVRTLFSYQFTAGQEDPLNRLQSVSYDTSRVDASLTVLSSPTVSYQYRTKSSPASLINVTQVKQIVADGVATEDFDYDAQGRIFEKRFTFANRPLPMTTTYGYDTLDRVNQITYPEQYKPSETPTRKVISQSYDVSSRIDSLQSNGVNHASQFTYNAASQIKSVLIGSGQNQLTESYTYEDSTGLLATQSVQRGTTTLMSYSYGYKLDYCDNPMAMCDSDPKWSAHTGQLTKVTNNTPGAQWQYQKFAYDELGRLKSAVQYSWIHLKPTPMWDQRIYWSQTYSYDRYGNRTQVAASNNTGVLPVPQDGLQSLTFDTASNRITTAGFSYDPTGNQLTNGTGQSFLYDAAGRLAQVKDENGATAVTYTYGASNRRLITQTGNLSSPNKTYYIWEADSVIAEYTDPSGAEMPQWAKNYIYLGARLLATEEPNGSGGEIVRYHHPDRLGTRLITNNVDLTYVQQNNLPFGTALDAEASPITNRRFTSYDRSSTTGLDYAVNRQYDSRQGRFTQPDPLGMAATSLADPQSLNMYSYVGNDPINRVDPDGQFWGAVFRFIAGLFRGLRPNVINGSFAYGNHPPITVSFTTNFQNISAGFGGLNFLLRSNGVWVTQAVRRSKKNLCDFLVSKMWDLFKQHNNEVGSAFTGNKRGRKDTNCYLYAENVLIYAYSQIGRPDVVARIKQGWTDPKGKGQFGAGLAQYLSSLGWTSYYWNPDVRNPADGRGYHSYEYQQFSRGASYYGYVPVQNFVINYRLTNQPAHNDMSAYSEFMNFRFGFGLVKGGLHNYLYSTGKIFEVHYEKL